MSLETSSKSPTKLAIGKKEETFAWLQTAIPWLEHADNFFGPCEAFTLLKEDGPKASFVGAVIFNNYRPWDKDIELNIYALSHILNKGICVALSRYVFGILACERCSLTIPKSAKQLRKVAEKAGFRREGTKRLGWRGRHNAMLYGMLKSECPWFDQAEWDKEQASEFGSERTAA